MGYGAAMLHSEAYFEVTEAQIKTNAQVFALPGVHIEMEIARLKRLQRRTMYLKLMPHEGKYIETPVRAFVFTV